MEQTVNSHVQQSLEAWKQLFEQHMELASSMSEEMGKIQTRTVDHTAALFDDLSRISQDTAGFAADIAVAPGKLDVFKTALDQQAQLANAMLDFAANMQQARVTQTRNVVKSFADFSRGSLDHVADASKAWQRVVVDAAKRTSSASAGE